MRRPAAFLDRDGVLIEDRGHVHRPADVRLLPVVAPALDRLKRAGWLLVVVTNQSGICRGLFQAQDYERTTAHLRALLPQIDAVYHCPHVPGDGCGCRKPAPGMLLQAADDLGIDLRRSIMVGDRWTDVLAGNAAGCAFSTICSLDKLPEWVFLD